MPNLSDDTIGLDGLTRKELQIPLTDEVRARLKQTLKTLDRGPSNQIRDLLRYDDTVKADIT